MKSKFLRKSLSLFMATAFVCSMSITAFAADDPSTDGNGDTYIEHDCTPDYSKEAYVEHFKEPGCNTRGIYNTYYPCEVCGELVYESRQVIAPLGHDYNYEDYYIVQEATCKDELLVGHRCNNCDDYIIDDELSHTYADHVFDHIEYTNRVEPHDGLNGSYTEEYVCSCCGEVYATMDIMIPWSDCEHEFVAYETVEATCTTDGYIKSHCDKCGDEDITVLEATGIHTPGEEVITWIKHPTCTDVGEYTAYITCEDCGATLDGSRVVVVSPTPHNYVEINEEATADHDGFIGNECLDCGHREGETVKYVAPVSNKKGPNANASDKAKENWNKNNGNNKDKTKNGNNGNNGNGKGNNGNNGNNGNGKGNNKNK